MYDTILSPIDYGGMQLKNRIIFAPTTFGLSDEEYLAEMERLAKGGCAMLIIGDVPVAKSRFEKSLFDKKGFAFYQQICEIAHKYGCKVCAQLHQTDTDMMSIIKCIPGMLMKKITPDQLRERMNDAVGPYITKMSQKKIHQIIAGFGKAAVLAKQAGFDMVQVHGDRMCGSFSSAIFNHRTDEYGGSAERRARFAVEAVKAVHAAVPGMAIDYKLAVRQENPHYGNAGVVEEELAVFVPLLVQAGVTSFHVTLANHSALVYQCAALRCGRPERPRFCGAAACQRPHPVRGNVPPAAGRPQLGQQTAERQCGKDPPLCPLQQKVPGRPDRPSGHPLCL